MSVASEIERIKGNIASAYTAASGKGATMPDVQNSANLAGCIDTITGGGEPVEKTKLGVTVDVFLGDVDENGVLKNASGTGVVNFAGVKEIYEAVLSGVFKQKKNITGANLSGVETIRSEGLRETFYNSGVSGFIDLGSLKTLGIYGLYSCFTNCSGITGVDLNSLEKITSYSLYQAFYGCSGLSGRIDLSSLTYVDTQGMNNAFRGCAKVTEIDVSSLATLGNGAMYNAFNGTSISKISFPSLISVASMSLSSSATSGGAFSNCSLLTEIHFRVDMQATIEAMTGYANKFGATNATIYFDL